MAVMQAPYSDGEIPAINGIIEKPPHQQPKASLLSGHHVAAAAKHEANGVSEYAIPMHDQLAFAPRKLRVITVGAGYSGLMMAHKFQHRFPEMRDIIEHKIFEARSDVGGTWLVNTYPGVQCDVPSHIYVSGHQHIRCLKLLTLPLRRFHLIRVPSGLISTQVAKKYTTTSSAL